MRLTNGGFTLLEVLIASLVIAIVVVGTMSAFIVASRILGTQNSSVYAEASACAQQKLEKFRNHVAAAVAGASDTFLEDHAPLGWQIDGSDDLSDCGSSNNSSISIRDTTSPPVRKFCVKRGDCNGNGILAGVGSPPEVDCYALLTKVCWNGTPCPNNGDTC